MPADPRAEWAGLTGGGSPTLTVAHHGAGAFDTVYADRPAAHEAAPVHPEAPTLAHSTAPPP